MDNKEKYEIVKRVCSGHRVNECYKCEIKSLCDECEGDFERNQKCLDAAVNAIMTDNKELFGDNVKLHHDICDYLKGLYERKNADYGDSFHETYLEEGMAMARIRLGDKFRRFKALTIGGEQRVMDESIRDTLIDLANYAIMTVVEIDREVLYGKEEKG